MRSRFHIKINPRAKPVNATSIRAGLGQNKAWGRTNKRVERNRANHLDAPNSINLEIMKPRKSSSSTTPALKNTKTSHHSGAAAVSPSRASVLVGFSPVNFMIKPNAATPKSASAKPIAAVEKVEREMLFMPIDDKSFLSLNMT